MVCIWTSPLKAFPLFVPFLDCTVRAFVGKTSIYPSVSVCISVKTPLREPGVTLQEKVTGTVITFTVYIERLHIVTYRKVPVTF